MTRSCLWLFWWLLLLNACGDGADAGSSAPLSADASEARPTCGPGAPAANCAPPSPTQSCIVAPVPIFELRFHTLQPGSTVNGQPLTGVFSTSLGPLCTAQDYICLRVENVRLFEGTPELFDGFGGASQFLGSPVSHATFILNGRGGVSKFTGTVTVANGQTRFDVTDGQGTDLVLIGD